MKELGQFQRYLIEEFVEDWREGHMSRRDMVRRTAYVTGGVASAATVLVSMGCGQAAAPTAAPTKPANTTHTQSVAAQTTPAAPDIVSAAPSSDLKTPPTNIKAMAQPRQPAPRPASRVLDTTPYSRPAPASDASAVATQQMIERYLGIRAGVSPQRSVQ